VVEGGGVVARRPHFNLFSGEKSTAGRQRIGARAGLYSLLTTVFPGVRFLALNAPDHSLLALARTAPGGPRLFADGEGGGHTSACRASFGWGAA
jgi:hypothetical protein